MNRSDADEAARYFRPYPKLLSWLVLHAAGLPTLPGIILTSWTADAASAAEQFASCWPSDRLLLRSDAAGETGNSPRGGFLVGGSCVEQACRGLLSQGRVVFLLEPISPLTDLYSANLAPDPDWRDWLLEVVGPGFDASDLKRGDVTPHETIWLTAHPSQVVISRRCRISPPGFAATRDVRLRKVAEMLNCGVAHVEHELRRRRRTLLLDFPGYPPIPDSLLSQAIQGAGQVRTALTDYGLNDQNVIISVSFIDRHQRMVFWDLVWPQSKYIVAEPPGTPPRQSGIQ
jgi:hypothetical protein